MLIKADIFYQVMCTPPVLIARYNQRNVIRQQRASYRVMFQNNEKKHITVIDFFLKKLTGFFLCEGHQKLLLSQIHTKETLCMF